MADLELKNECGGIASIISSLESKGRTYDLMAAVALKRGNAAARDMFASHGGDIFIDVLMLSPTETVAGFLGVSHDYLLNMLNRYGFSTKKTPDDVRAARLNTRFIGDAPYDIYKSTDGNASLCHRVRRQNISVASANSSSFFITPRVALCICFLMKYGQRIPKNSMAMVIARNAENGSAYGLEALEMQRKIREKELAAKRAEQEARQVSVEIPDVDMASMSNNGDVKMTTEFFAEIFKDFSMQFATAFSTEFAKTIAGMVKQYKGAVSSDYIPDTTPVIKEKNQKFIEAGERNRFKAHDNPDNWDELVRMYNNGEITIAGIARQVGWSTPTVSRHLKQSAGFTSVKSNGVTFGRPRIEKPDNWSEVMELWHSGKITAKKAMEMTGTKRGTFYKLAENSI